jgi:oxalate decarboxylase/phosphoglucose isomerase-like protein (cupin superfamily)
VQFYLGPPGTGAPMHYHLDAVNVLLHGEKDWLLLPPAAAVYSTERAAGLFQSLAAGRAAAAGPPPMLCTQRAGDAMFVPRGWGHAILNTRTSVGYAVEFATPLQIY